MATRAEISVQLLDVVLRTAKGDPASVQPCAENAAVAFTVEKARDLERQPGFTAFDPHTGRTGRAHLGCKLNAEPISHVRTDREYFSRE